MLLTLSPHWRQIAIADGIASRQHAVRTKGKQYGNQNSELLKSVSNQTWTFRSAGGLVAQCAVCALFKTPYRPEAGKKNPIDIGNVLNVRGRMMPRYQAELPIKPEKDQDEIPTILVRVWKPIETDGVLDAVGWLYGGEAKEIGKRIGKWDGHYLCWYVPPPYRSMEELLKMYPPGTIL
jgi:hypothetical protein